MLQKRYVTQKPLNEEFNYSNKKKKLDSKEKEAT
jgi:hypothetical protein